MRRYVAVKEPRSLDKDAHKVGKVLEHCLHLSTPGLTMALRKVLPTLGLWDATSLAKALKANATKDAEG